MPSQDSNLHSYGFEPRFKLLITPKRHRHISILRRLRDLNPRADGLHRPSTLAVCPLHQLG